MKYGKFFSVTVFTLLMVAGAVRAEELAGDADHGASLFDRHCGACHSMTANRVGPILSGVYGRQAGNVPNFTYSAAVKASSVTWNSETLDKWLSGPQQFLPGQKMNFSMSDPQKRADIIAYLKKESAPGK